MMPRRRTPARNAKLGADTVADLRATFPGRTLDEAVRALLRVAHDVVTSTGDALKSRRSGVPIRTQSDIDVG